MFATNRIPFRLIAPRQAKTYDLCSSRVALARGMRTGTMKRPDHAINIVRFVIARIGWQRAMGVLILRIAERESH